MCDLLFSKFAFTFNLCRYAMAVSVLWLKRSYAAHDYVAAGFMVASAAFFGLGERELEPEGNQFMVGRI
jgi:hypothetical protein